MESLLDQSSLFLQQLVNGITLGGVYALIAVGYTMVYGVIQLINFAHGEIYMLGAFSRLHPGGRCGNALFSGICSDPVDLRCSGCCARFCGLSPFAKGPSTGCVDYRNWHVHISSEHGDADLGKPDQIIPLGTFTGFFF